MKKITIGQYINPSTGELAREMCHLDLAVLLETRLLVMANSGQGKSRALRSVCEQAAPLVQEIVIDLEGEFPSLREKFDFVIGAASGADFVLHPRTAALLALRLRETRISAVLDLSELKANQRHEFVQRFLNGLIEAPKKLWNSCIVVMDEAQVWAPEKGQGESIASDSVMDLAIRGRKRGLALIAATLRPSALLKSVSAEIKNRMIGGISEDNDVKRAAFNLGWSPAEARDRLRELKAGQFLAYGPAFHHNDPQLMVTGEVLTTHPTVGMRKQMEPPKPTKAVIAMLPKLADLPQEVEKKAATEADLRKQVADGARQIADLQRQLSAKPAAASPEALRAAEDRGFARGQSEAAQASRRAAQASLKALRGGLHQAIETILTGAESGLKEAAALPQITVHTAADKRAAELMAPALVKAISKIKVPRVDYVTPTVDLSSDLPPIVRKILDTIHRSYPVGLSFASAALRAGVSKKSSAYRKYAALVAQSAEVEDVDGRYRSKPAFASAAPVNAGDGLSQWVAKLPASYGKMLTAIHERGPIDKQTVAELAGVSPTSSGLGTGLRELMSLALIVENSGAYEVADGLR